jgi:hypothetical protein
MGKIKICLKLLSLRLGHTAVESAEGKALLTKRFCSKGDECKPTLDLVPQRGSGPPQIPAVPVRGDLAVYGPMARPCLYPSH